MAFSLTAARKAITGWIGRKDRKIANLEKDLAEQKKAKREAHNEKRAAERRADAAEGFISELQTMAEAEQASEKGDGDETGVVGVPDPDVA